MSMKPLVIVFIIFLGLAIIFGGTRGNNGGIVDTNAIEPVLEVNYNQGW